jgi:hypothetical protein
MTHRAEIERWAKCPDGTGVWVQRENGGEWTLKIIATWNPDRIYIVDDEYAEVRKFFVDNGFVWIKIAFKWAKIFECDFLETIDHYATSNPEQSESDTISLVDSSCKVIKLNHSKIIEWLTKSDDIFDSMSRDDLQELNNAVIKAILRRMMN